MHRLWMLGLLLWTGCQGVRGPLQPQPTTRPDDPKLTIQEQQERVRDRIGFPVESPAVGPNLNSWVPGTPPH